MTDLTPSNDDLADLIRAPSRNTHAKDPLDIREEIARIDHYRAEIQKLLVETRALKTRTFPTTVVALIVAALLTFLASGTGLYLMQTYLPAG